MILPPEDISLGQVMDVVEGSIKAKERTTNASPDSSAVKVLQKAWCEVETVERDMLEKVTFADLLEQSKKLDAK